jgi:hypothetical protein
VTPAIQSKLNQIFEYPFFQRCGTDLPKTVTRVENWQTAVEECTSQKSENCRLMARNVLQRQTEERSWERSNEWNSIVQEIRPLIDAFATNVVTKGPAPKELAYKLKNDVRWDILFICLEFEYKDIVPPYFYIPYLDNWYAAGHLPCGWDGEEFPERLGDIITRGHLMVF